MSKIIVSTFNGMSIGQQALENLGISTRHYFSSEIKPHAIEVTQHNYPHTIQIGDVTKVKYKDTILSSEK